MSLYIKSKNSVSFHGLTKLTLKRSSENKITRQDNKKNITRISMPEKKILGKTACVFIVRSYILLLLTAKKEAEI